MSFQSFQWMLSPVATLHWLILARWTIVPTPELKSVLYSSITNRKRDFGSIDSHFSRSRRRVPTVGEITSTIAAFFTFVTRQEMQEFGKTHLYIFLYERSRVFALCFAFRIGENRILIASGPLRFSSLFRRVCRKRSSFAEVFVPGSSLRSNVCFSAVKFPQRVLTGLLTSHSFLCFASNETAEEKETDSGGKNSGEKGETRRRGSRSGTNRGDHCFARLFMKSTGWTRRPPGKKAKFVIKSRVVPRYRFHLSN